MSGRGVGIFCRFTVIQQNKKHKHNDLDRRRIPIQTHALPGLPLDSVFPPGLKSDSVGSNGKTNFPPGLAATISMNEWPFAHSERHSEKKEVDLYNRPIWLHIVHKGYFAARCICTTKVMKQNIEISF